MSISESSLKKIRKLTILTSQAYIGYYSDHLFIYISDSLLPHDHNIYSSANLWRHTNITSGHLKNLKNTQQKWLVHYSIGSTLFDDCNVLWCFLVLNMSLWSLFFSINDFGTQRRGNMILIIHEFLKTFQLLEIVIFLKTENYKEVTNIKLPLYVHSPHVNSSTALNCSVTLCCQNLNQLDTWVIRLHL